MDINSVILIGRLANDAGLTHTPSGKAVGKFGLAVSGRDKDSASFFNIVAWEKIADFCAQYLKKGDRVCVRGRLEQRQWVAQDGTRRSTIEIIAEQVQGLQAPKDANASSNAAPKEKVSDNEPYGFDGGEW